MERFGISLTSLEYSKICYEIREYINWPVHINEDNGRSFHHFFIQETDLVFLYDWEYDVILTAYRKNWFDTKESSFWSRKPRKVKSKRIRNRDRARALKEGSI